MEVVSFHRGGTRKRLAVSTDAGVEIIKTENVTKRFGELTAVDHVNYLLRENEVAGIIRIQRGREDHLLQPPDRVLPAR